VTCVATPHILLHASQNSQSKLFMFPSQYGVLTFRGTEVKCMKVNL